MKFTPEKYKIEDRSQEVFIDEGEIWEILNNARPDKQKVRDIISKSLSKSRLSLYDTAVLLKSEDPDLVEEIKEGARKLKEQVYGKRIVLFAPLYVGNYCINNCRYCGFRSTNKSQLRTTLTVEELINQVEALEDAGHKRLILVYGEHPRYNADFIYETVKIVYNVKKWRGEIRRVNINAAPLDIDGFRRVKEAGIGTYQIFQETYHKETYNYFHPSGPKKYFDWRLTALDRAQEAGIDDVGIGALFGLYDWRFEVMGLLRHVNHLEAVYNVGPHTISFPRLQNASGIERNRLMPVSDDEFIRMVAILRLAVPYTGLILTAREPAHIRNQLLTFGVSQIDGGTNIEIGGYTRDNNGQNLDLEQFEINDNRPLSDVIDELIRQGLLPSFCTSCYRTGRTGEHFMEFSVPGFIKRFCQPNAILTLAEYLEDYAPADVKEKGYQLIDKEIRQMDNENFKQNLLQKLELIKSGKRDLYY
ncbi:MAG: [FeFe] hydrogenase H-cluster radical SAM maturase HydG [Bacteroidales bacterium]|nr:[FeFe] hydrogenase H-cluster radical SAM maturase HydG [Bacteroidales bacterium]